MLIKKQKLQCACTASETPLHSKNDTSLTWMARSQKKERKKKNFFWKRHPLPSKHKCLHKHFMYSSLCQSQYMYPALPARTYPVHLYFLWEIGWLANRDRVHNTESLNPKTTTTTWFMVSASDSSPSICYFASLITFLVFFKRFTQVFIVHVLAASTSQYFPTSSKIN